MSSPIKVDWREVALELAVAVATVVIALATRAKPSRL
jgi:hypothetical protein